MKKKKTNPSLNELTVLDFFAAMALIGMGASKTPLTKRAQLAYGIGQEMLLVRLEIEELENE
jgi:hypothetical protein